MSPRVLACVVAYLPQADRLAALIERLLPDVAGLLVIDNGQTIDPQAAPWNQMQGVQWYRASRNLGMGAALEIARGRVLAEGYDFLLSFDQDSLPPPGYVPQLLGIWAREADATWAALGAAVVDEATGAPLPVTRVDGRGGLVASSALVPGPAAAVDHVITSGCLVAAPALAAVGPFRADWFIDLVDTEWCWRARHRGLAVVQTGDVAMVHTIGRAGVRVLGRRVLAHAPARVYFQVRNALWLLRSREVPAGWRRHLVAPLLRKVVLQALLPDQRLARWGAVARGGWQGLVGRPDAQDRSRV
ncbi:putative glycosyltransferase [Acidovorax sp. CF316]|uniref:hypothetical protein n=1 Tax=Acidovorax sp. CF316 TaxID=1144317 RepID=UPI00026BD335|nr:hypothetical protein [Acidovorax sp. CF316]EJE53639.1 putative glycosyltransferase [Acidovorax sp. CF316]